jgi:hypothetical protein
MNARRDSRAGSRSAIASISSGRRVRANAPPSRQWCHVVHGRAPSGVPRAHRSCQRPESPTLTFCARSREGPDFRSPRSAAHRSSPAPLARPASAPRAAPAARREAAASHRRSHSQCSLGCPAASAIRPLARARRAPTGWLEGSWSRGRSAPDRSVTPCRYPRPLRQSVPGGAEHQLVDPIADLGGEQGDERNGEPVGYAFVCAFPTASRSSQVWSRLRAPPPATSSFEPTARARESEATPAGSDLRPGRPPGGWRLRPSSCRRQTACSARFSATRPTI